MAVSPIRESMEGLYQKYALHLNRRNALVTSHVPSQSDRDPSFRSDLMGEDHPDLVRNVSVIDRSHLDSHAKTPPPGLVTAGAEQDSFFQESLDHKEVESTCLLALASLLHLRETPGEGSKKTMEEYIQKVFGLQRDKLEQLKERAKEVECPDLKLICTVLDATGLVAKDANGKSDPYCRIGILAQKHQGSHLVKHKNLAVWQKEGIVKEVVYTSVKPETLSPKWDEHFELSITNPKEELLVLEVWDSDTTSVSATKIRGLKGLGNFLTDLKKNVDDYMGRAFYLLQTIPVQGEERTLSLLSHSRKHEYGKVRVRLSIRGLRENTPIEVSLKEHKMLMKALVNFESKEEGEHQSWWEAKLSDKAEKLLLQHATLYGINGLQKAAVSLSVLLEYHKRYAVLMSAFSSQLLEIKEHRLMLPGVSPQDPDECTLTEQPWVVQMFADLHDIFQNIVDLMKNHLGVFSLKSQHDIERIRSHVLTLKDFYSLRMLVQRLTPDQKYLAEVLERCIQSSVPRWFLVLCGKLMPLVNTSEQQLHAFQGLSQHCLHQCGRALQSLNPIFKEVNVDYFTHFFVALDKLLHGEAVSRLENYKEAMQSTTFEIYTIFQEISKFTEHVDPSVRDGLQINNYHQWFKGMVNGWIQMATNRCKSRIQQAIKLDQVVQVTDEAKFSSSAVDTKALLLGIGSFWKHLNWPIPAVAYGFTVTIMESICNCALFYVGAVYQSLGDPDMYDERGQFRATEKLCIVLNNMAHVRKALWELPKELDLQTFYDWVEEEEKIGTQAKKLIDSLISSSDEDIANKTSHIVLQISRKLSPDIQQFIQNMIEKTSGTDVEAITPLLDYLTSNLQTLGDYLLSEVLWGILIDLWEETLQLMQKALSNMPKKLSSRFLYKRMYNALQMLREFFYADGNGVAKADLESQMYKSLFVQLETLRLPTPALVHTFMSELAEKQQVEVERGNRKLGTLLLTVGYLRQKGVVEVSIIQAQQLPGLDKSGLSDPFVELSLLPEWLFPESAREFFKTTVHKQTVDPVFNEEFKMPAKEDSLDENGAILMLAIYDHDMFGSNDFAGLCAVACKDIPRLSKHTSMSDPNAMKKKNLILPLFRPPETIAFRELETRYHLNDPDATNFWKSQRKFMEKIFSHPASGRGSRITASNLGTKITAAFDSLNINTRS